MGTAASLFKEKDVSTTPFSRTAYPISFKTKRVCGKWNRNTS